MEQLLTHRIATRHTLENLSFWQACTAFTAQVLRNGLIEIILQAKKEHLVIVGTFGSVEVMIEQVLGMTVFCFRKTGENGPLLIESDLSNQDEFRHSIVPCPIDIKAATKILEEVVKNWPESPEKRKTIFRLATEGA